MERALGSCRSAKRWLFLGQLLSFVNYSESQSQGSINLLPRNFDPIGSKRALSAPQRQKIQ
jgi:hypothetical protein